MSKGTVNQYKIWIKAPALPIHRCMDLSFPRLSLLDHRRLPSTQ
jgi:hypothetical protein